MSNLQLPILTVGLEPEIEKVVADILKNTQVISAPLELEQLPNTSDSPPPCLIICGPPQNKPAIELAEALRAHYPEIPIFICCTSKAGFERKALITHGFTDAFLMPMDSNALRHSLSEALGKASNGLLRVYRPVKIIDLEPGISLDFEVSLFLPANKKYVKLSNAGDSLDSERIAKMKEAKFNTVQVPIEQMSKFYDYSARRLKEINSSGFSSTERKENLAGAVRDLISGLFAEQDSTFESGQAILKDCGEIVKSYILQDADNEWFSRIQQVLGEHGDQYSHSANVSTLAALFSMGLGIGKPEDLALAGLLHDIGIAELPPELQPLEPEDMRPDQLEEYKKHVELSVKLIDSKKIAISDTVVKAIVQHHEFYNGSGYPDGLSGIQITKEAQILALADDYDTLTRMIEGKPLTTPAQAVEKLRLIQVHDPSQIHYDPELLKQLLTLFPHEKTI